MGKDPSPAIAASLSPAKHFGADLHTADPGIIVKLNCIVCIILCLSLGLYWSVVGYNANSLR